MLYKIHKLTHGKLVGQSMAKTKEAAHEKAQAWVYMTEHNRAMLYQVHKGKSKLIRAYWHDLIRLQYVEY